MHSVIGGFLFESFPAKLQVTEICHSGSGDMLQFRWDVLVRHSSSRCATRIIRNYPYLLLDVFVRAAWHIQHAPLLIRVANNHSRRHYSLLIS